MSAPSPAARAARMFRLSIGTYLSGGFIVSLISLLVPRLKLLMGLDYFRASLVQLAFHSSYLLFALPITALLVRIGYMRGMAAGLAVMALGCAGFVAAAGAASYGAVLLALLALAGGITFLQIAGNIVVAVVEPEARVISRMTLLQGFNSLGTVLAPLIGASFLLTENSAAGTERAWATLALPFVASTLVLLALAVAFWRARDLLAGLPAPRRMPLAGLGRVLADRRLLAGTAAMFAYVGAEVTIGTLLTNYLVQPAILGVSPAAAGRLVSLYWAGAMAGRFLGALVLVRWPPPRVLAGVAAGAVALVALAIAATGPLGAAALIAVGLMNAIMYPTLFALSLPDDEGAAPYAAMALCMAVVGGAVVPVLTGALADAYGLAASLALPALCYLGIAAFALACAGAWARPRLALA
ncbi:MFS transporter [uncultured Sphingomonas sp.]|uniref:MFS transporter n=1 Tax=uncultured Sphingomonas sp. TaxID=158754 RepID=UPI0035C9D6CC